MIQRNTVKNMVAYTCGVPRQQLAQPVGICRQKQSLKLCSLQSVASQQRVKYSNRLVVGIIAVTARTPTCSRRCLPATGMAVGNTSARAAKRTFGVLLRAIAISYSTYSCTTTAAKRKSTSTSRMSVFQFVASKGNRLKKCHLLPLASHRSRAVV